jgi:hypothetical protein
LAALRRTIEWRREAPAPLLICDDAHGRHVWDAEFTDGDTCACGKFYLDLHPAQGFAAELNETSKEE